MAVYKAIYSPFRTIISATAGSTVGHADSAVHDAINEDVTKTNTQNSDTTYWQSTGSTVTATIGWSADDAYLPPPEATSVASYLVRARIVTNTTDDSGFLTSNLSGKTSTNAAGFSVSGMQVTGQTGTTERLVTSNAITTSGADANLANWYDITSFITTGVSQVGGSNDAGRYIRTYGMELEVSYNVNAPVNDLFANATLVGATPSTQVIRTHNTNATVEVGEPKPTDQYNTIWYRWHPDASLNGTTVDITQTAVAPTATLDTLLSIYRADFTTSLFSDLTSVGSSDDFAGASVSQVSFVVDSSKVYYIAAGSYAASASDALSQNRHGSFTLSIPATATEPSFGTIHRASAALSGSTNFFPPGIVTKSSGAIALSAATNMATIATKDVVTAPALSAQTTLTAVLSKQHNGVVALSNTSNVTVVKGRTSKVLVPVADINASNVINSVSTTSNLYTYIDETPSTGNTSFVSNNTGASAQLLVLLTPNAFPPGTLSIDSVNVSLVLDSDEVSDDTVSFSFTIRNNTDGGILADSSSFIVDPPTSKTLYANFPTDFQSFDTDDTDPARWADTYLSLDWIYAVSTLNDNTRVRLYDINAVVEYTQGVYAGPITLSAATSVVAAPTATKIASAALSGQTTASIITTKTIPAIPNGLSATSTLTDVPGKLTVTGGVFVFTQATSVTATAITGQVGVAALSAQTSVTTVGKNNVMLGALLSQVSNLTVASKLTISGSAILDGVNTGTTLVVDELILHTGIFALSALGSLVVTEQVIRTGIFALSAGTSVTSQGVRITFGAAALSGNTNANIVTTVGVRAAAAVSGNTNLSTDGSRAQFGVAVLDQKFSVTSAGKVDVRGIFALSGTTNIVVNAAREQYAAATLSAQSNVATKGTGVPLGKIEIAAESLLSIAGAPGRFGIVALSARGDATIIGTNVTGSTAALSALTTLTFNGTRSRVAGSTMDAATGLAVSGRTIVRGVFDLSQRYDLTADATKSIRAIAALNNNTNLVATAVVTRFGFTNTLTALGNVSTIGTNRVTSAFAFSQFTDLLPVPSIKTNVARADLAAQTAFTSSGRQLIKAASTITTETFIVVPGTLVRVGMSLGSGATDVTANGVLDIQAAAALSNSTTIFADGNSTVSSGSITFSASGDVSSRGDLYNIIEAQFALSQVSAITVTATKSTFASTVLSASANVDFANGRAFTPRFAGPIALAANTVVDTKGTNVVRGASDLFANSAMGTNGRVFQVLKEIITLNANTAFTPVATPRVQAGPIFFPLFTTFNSAAYLQKFSQIIKADAVTNASTVGTRVVVGVVALSANANVAVEGRFIRTGAAALASRSDLTALGRLRVTGRFVEDLDTELSAGTTLTTVTRVFQVLKGVAALSATGSFDPTTYKVTYGIVSMQAVATCLNKDYIELISKIVMNPVARIDVDGLVNSPCGPIPINGRTTLAAENKVTQVASVALSNSGTVTAKEFLVQFASVSMSARTTVTAVDDIRAPKVAQIALQATGSVEPKGFNTAVASVLVFSRPTVTTVGRVFQIVTAEARLFCEPRFNPSAFVNVQSTPRVLAAQGRTVSRGEKTVVNFPRVFQNGVWELIQVKIYVGGEWVQRPVKRYIDGAWRIN